MAAPGAALYMEQHGVFHTTLVIEKDLSVADVSRVHGHLTLPLSSVTTAASFLTPEEEAALSHHEAISATVLHPGNTGPTDVNLKRFDMIKNIEDGGAITMISSAYVLAGRWNNVVRDGNLHAGQRIRLLSFRLEGRLFLALIIVARDS